jgi:ATP-binding cassette, subfamily B, bacterial
MSLILSYIKKYRRLIIRSVVLATINQAFSLINPQIFRILIDQYANQIEVHTQASFVAGIVKWSLIGVGAALVSRTAKTFQDYYVNLVSQKIGATIYGQGIAHAFGLPYRVFEDWQSGSLLDKLLKARNDIQNLLNSMINNVFLTLIGVLIVTVYAFYVHWLIGTLFIAIIPILALTTLRISRGVKDAQKRIVKTSSELS